MDKLTSIAKGGWHPEKASRSSSYDQPKGIRDRAKGLMGKGPEPYEDPRNHQSRPLSSLKDPASFAPPPKHQAYYGNGATGSTASSPVNRGSGAPPPAGEVQEEENRPPPGPYRADTTGLSTAHLPKPPVRRPGQEVQSPSSASPKPKLPPRLPPRQNSHPDVHAPPPPPTYQESVQSPPTNNGLMKHGAMHRLGQAGVSVPGFNIGRTASPPVPARNATPPVPQRTGQTPPMPPASPGQLGQLQSRFAKMGTASSGPATGPEGGTTLAQKQAAFNTAHALRANPSSVSASDLRSAASTANNFHQRHGDQVASGWKAANGVNQKYGVLERANGLASPGKKPPPPPPKKKELSEQAVGAAPPVPVGSKPRW